MRQLSATFRSVFTTAASFPHPRKAACKSLFVKILPVSRLNPRFYGRKQQPVSRKPNESKILRGASQKNRNCRWSRKSFVSKILRVNYLESIFCGVYRALERKQLQQNQDFANLSHKKFFAHRIFKQPPSEFAAFMGDWSRTGAFVLNMMCHTN